MTEKKAPFLPQDIVQMRFVAEPTLSPDGRFWAYTRYFSAEDQKSFVSEVELCGGNFLSLQGESRKLPAFSPTGDVLAYLSNRSGQWQVWLRENKNGQCRQLTHARYGVKRFAWSPDGGQIAFEAAWWPQDDQQGCFFTQMSEEEAEEHRRALDMAPQIIEDIIYKRDETFGVFDGSIQHIALIDVGTGEHRLICGGSMPALMPAFSPDGKYLAFFGRPYGDKRAMEYEAFICGADGQGLRQLTDGKYIQANSPPCFTSDGQAVVYMAMTVDEKNDGCMLSLYRKPLNGGEAVILTPEEDEGAGCGAWCMPANRSVLSPLDALFTQDGGYIYYLTARRGREMLCRVPERGGRAEVIVQGDFCVSAFSLAAGKALLRRGSPEHIPDICAYDQNTGEYAGISQENSWASLRQTARTSELWFTPQGSETPVQAWVSLPETMGAGEKVPAVLYIHGGPTVASMHDFWHEIQALTSAGIAVITCNPRGSTGYGMGFASDSMAWGEAAVSDLLEAVEQACRAFPCIDCARIGVTGGSYGGYMTVKLVSTTKRFKAAVGQRILCNPATSYGTGDMGFISAAKDPASIDMAEVLEGRAKRSLIAGVDSIDTPFLLLHGFRDYRCSFEQAEQLFAAMKDRRPDVPVRLVMFPAGNHNVARDGRPCDMVRHVGEMVDWLAKYLKKGGKSDE